MGFGVADWMIAGLAIVGLVVVGAALLKGLVWILASIEDACQPRVKKKMKAVQSATYTGHGT